MKNYLKFACLIVLLFSVSQVDIKAQGIHSCCSATSTSQFAMLGNDNAFVASHLSPIPFNYESKNGRMISFVTRDGNKAAAFFVPSPAASTNYLIVIHEWWGLNDYIKREAEKLQEELGNVNVIALDLYDGKVATTAEEASKYMSGATEERLKAIVGGAIDHAGKDANIQTIGWCFGGGWSMQASLLAGIQAKGCVIYYGMPEKDTAKLKSLSGPVLGIFAAKDQWITPEVVTQFQKNMVDNKKVITIKTFDADHAFANPSNPKYDKKAADEAHVLAVEFLKKNLK